MPLATASRSRFVVNIAMTLSRWAGGRLALMLLAISASNCLGGVALEVALSLGAAILRRVGKRLCAHAANGDGGEQHDEKKRQEGEAIHRGKMAEKGTP